MQPFSVSSPVKQSRTTATTATRSKSTPSKPALEKSSIPPDQPDQPTTTAPTTMAEPDASAPATKAPKTKNECPLSRSGPIDWAYIQNWGQCRPHVSAINAKQIADFISKFVDNFSCSVCVEDARNDLGPNGSFSMAQPKKVFTSKDALVYFLWAWRTSVTVKTKGRVMSWEDYCKKWNWSGQPVPSAIPNWSAQAQLYHTTPWKEKWMRFFGFIFNTGTLWMVLGMVLGAMIATMYKRRHSLPQDENRPRRQVVVS